MVKIYFRYAKAILHKPLRMLPSVPGGPATSAAGRAPPGPAALASAAGRRSARATGPARARGAAGSRGRRHRHPAAGAREGAAHPGRGAARSLLRNSGRARADRAHLLLQRVQATPKVGLVAREAVDLRLEGGDAGVERLHLVPGSLRRLIGGRQDLGPESVHVVLGG